MWSVFDAVNSLNIKKAIKKGNKKTKIKNEALLFVVECDVDIIGLYWW